MSQSTENEPQFETLAPRAGAGADACAACQRTIPDLYFEAGGKVFCAACKDAASQSGGSGPARLVKAGLFGVVAAAASAAAWYGIVRLTGYELGIVAVVVGLVVGGAVRMGAEHRGGWLYQSLAVLLTYLAIAASYVPLTLESLREEAAQEVNERAAGEAGASSEAASTPPEGLVLSETDEGALLTIAIIGALVLPVLQVTEGGFIGLLIVGFALYEAWKINRRQRTAFSGPFSLQRSPDASPA